MVLDTVLQRLLATGDGWYDPHTLAVLAASYGALYLWVGPALTRCYHTRGGRLLRRLRRAAWRRLRRLHVAHHLSRPQLRTPDELWTCSWGRYTKLVVTAAGVLTLDLVLLWGVVPRVTMASGLPLELGLGVALLVWAAGSRLHSVERRLAAGSLLVGLWLVGHPWLAVVVPLLAMAGMALVGTIIRALERIDPTPDPAL